MKGFTLIISCLLAFCIFQQCVGDEKPRELQLPAQVRHVRSPGLRRSYTGERQQAPLRGRRAETMHSMLNSKQRTGRRQEDPMVQGRRAGARYNKMQAGRRKEAILKARRGAALADMSE